MKLHLYTTGHFAGILFLLLTLWAVIFYFEMLDEIYDSIDDGLENQKMLVLEKAEKDSSILDQSSFEDGYYRITQVPVRNVEESSDSYRDTLMYMQAEEDYEPIRLLESFFAQQGKSYKIEVITSMVEEDDLIKQLFLSLLWLYFGLILSIVLLNSLLHRKIWKPFYRLLSRLGSFSIERDNKIQLESSRIDEFRLLNAEIEKLIRKSVESYDQQKEFIENASHELQTPLAISINKLELLIEKNQLNEESIEEIGGVLELLERLTRFNKSLLLLSKIENRQFQEEEPVNFAELAKKLSADFQDLANYKQVGIEIVEEEQIEYPMNRDLASILLSNLLKNALLHGKGGTIRILLQKNRVSVRNSAVQGALDKKKLFSRFQPIRDGKKSTGLGLAISKAIAEKYGLELRYHFNGEHIFELEFPSGNLKV